MRSIATITIRAMIFLVPLGSLLALAAATFAWLFGHRVEAFVVGLVAVYLGVSSLRPFPYKSQPERALRHLIVAAFTLGWIVLEWAQMHLENQVALPLIGALCGLLVVNSLFQRVQTTAPAVATDKSELPDMRLVDADGKAIQLSSLRDQANLFVFFRGNWCAYCQSHLADLTERHEEFRTRGIRVILVSSQPILRLKDAERKFGSHFFYLSDENQQLIDYLGIRDPGGTAIPLGIRFGADTVVPLQILMAPGGRIIHFYTTANVQERPKPSLILSDFDEFMARDILERRVADRTRELNQALDEKRGLFRLVIHDLANTQQIVQTSSEIALKTVEEPKQKSLWSRVSRASLIQANIMGYATTVEAIASGKHPIDLKPVQLGNLVEDLEFLFQERAKAKGVTLEIDRNSLTGVTILADKNLLANQVIGNLVSNSLKFTEPGGFIKVYGERSDGFFNLGVRDSGIGIPTKILADLFRVDKPTSRPGTAGEKGTGFGMPLVKSYVGLFGGTISVESRSLDEDPVNHGTVCTVRLKNAA